MTSDAGRNHSPSLSSSQSSHAACECVCVCIVCMGGVGAQSVYQPHSLCKEAVQRPAGSAADAAVPSARWQEGEKGGKGP